MSSGTAETVFSVAVQSQMFFLYFLHCVNLQNTIIFEHVYWCNGQVVIAAVLGSIPPLSHLLYRAVEFSVKCCINLREKKRKRLPFRNTIITECTYITLF